MDNYISRLVDRHVVPGFPALQPRIPSRFEDNQSFRTDLHQEDVVSVVQPELSAESNRATRPSAFPLKQPGESLQENRWPGNSTGHFEVDDSWRSRLNHAEENIRSMLNADLKDSESPIQKDFRIANVALPSTPATKKEFTQAQDIFPASLDKPSLKPAAPPVILAEPIVRKQVFPVGTNRNTNPPNITAETLPRETAATANVHVSIGRIEIRTPKPKTDRPKPVSNVAKSKIMTLDDYVRMRRGGTG